MILKLISDVYMGLGIYCVAGIAFWCAIWSLARLANWYVSGDQS